MPHTTVDLNSDVGERPDAIAQDAEILRSVTSANVACGFHAGDPDTMRAVCGLAAKGGVSVGAHVSYNDREGFGRRELEVESVRLIAETIEQIAALAEIAALEGAAISYVKPHGALYNRCVTDDVQARAVVAAILTFDPSLMVLGMPRSALTRAARAIGLRASDEGYADRAYLPTGELAPRDSPGAVLDLESAVTQALALVIHGTATAVDGTELELRVHSLCVHSDTPGAPALTRDLRTAFEQAGVEVRSFT
jgi:UPF0271 protein